ncbi:MFS transporter [Glutamicibacter sp. MNS18]|uniref:MFS transporter n=1 Tax=Glutamicibacter sp. MNS18 TaxID=2989817 RepID=UPI0022361EE4|nr:MFS transporter [Glutamicibacter sp. MNS18]MCW4464713.1 MFS transporter [Glutamicibacter sp. MNS18]
MTRSFSARQIQQVRRRSIAVLALGQVLGGMGAGATLTLGSLLIVNVAGSEALAGMAATMNTVGAAAMAIPLAVLAQNRGRRVALSSGALIAILGILVILAAAVQQWWPLLLAGMGLLGTGSALNLQSRFAATDLSSPETRGRDLSLVVWATTIGAVAGPNLFQPGEIISQAWGLPEFTGGFVIAMGAQAVGMAIYWIGLRPDPMHVALAREGKTGGGLVKRASGFSLLRTSSSARQAVLTVALSHAHMVALMAMTPIHLQHHGASLTLIGVTISAHVAGMYALSPLFGWLSDTLGARYVVIGGQALFVIASFSAWFWRDDYVMVTFALVCLGLGWSASTVAGASMVTGAVAIEQRPQLQGTSDLVMNLCGAGGGILAGPVLAWLGYGGLSLVLLGLALVVIFLNRGIFGKPALS